MTASSTGSPTPRRRQDPSGALGEEELLEGLRAISNPIRLSLLEWLKHPEDFPPQARTAAGGVCVKHLRDRAGISQPTTSQYLAVLQRAGLVSSSRDGRWTYFSRNEEQIERVMTALRSRLSL